MTTEEHLLLIHMLTQQKRLIMTLMQALKSNDLLSPGDLAAFDAVAFPSESAVVEFERQVNREYQRAGKTLGVKNLPDLLE